MKTTMTQDEMKAVAAMVAERMMAARIRLAQIKVPK